MSCWSGAKRNRQGQLASRREQCFDPQGTVLLLSLPPSLGVLLGSSSLLYVVVVVLLLLLERGCNTLRAKIADTTCHPDISYPDYLV